MASFYDSASIITIPSGYKAGTLYSAKPTDGTGDMTFTRTGDTATRVNSAGIIESCITNVMLQSNNFLSGSWANSNLNVTANIADPEGGTTAFQIAGTSSTSNVKSLTQGSFPSGTNTKTFSVYAKANTHNFLQVRLGNTSTYVNFDLSTGTFSNGGGASGTMTSLGGGWYRCVCVGLSASSVNGILVLVDSLSALASDPSTTTNSVYIWRAQGELGDFATNYIPTTTTAVTEGPVTNLPRLDYFGSTCPQLLMEPTRTNLMIYSQMMDVSAWAKVASTTITSNTITSPDGYTNADLVTGGANNSLSRIAQNFNAVSGTTYAFSAFVKQGPDNAQTAIRMISNANANIGGISIVFTGGVPAITATGITLNAKAESFGNGWYRISGTYVAPVTETNRFAYYSDTAGTNKSSYFWGAQLEAGAYATSYIPTTAATVTRNVDVMSKTSITSLLGQDEGTLFIDINRNASSNAGTDSSYVSINSTFANRLTIFWTANNSISIQMRVNSATIYTKTITTNLDRNKIAVGYKLNDLALYLNGQLIETSAITADFTTYNITKINYEAGATTNFIQTKFNQALVFKTRLSNDELATLTTL